MDGSILEGCYTSGGWRMALDSSWSGALDLSENEEGGDNGSARISDRSGCDKCDFEKYSGTDTPL